MFNTYIFMNVFLTTYFNAYKLPLWIVDTRAQIFVPIVKHYIKRTVLLTWNINILTLITYLR